MGVDYRTWQLQRNLADDFLGDYGFNPSTVVTNSVGCPTVACGTGNEMADFLLGYYNNVGTYQPGPQSPTDQAGNPQVHQFSYFAPYITDSFKASPNLTLDVGVRWDYRAAPYEDAQSLLLAGCTESARRNVLRRYSTVDEWSRS